MRTSYQLTHLITLPIGLSIAMLSAVIAIGWSTAPGNTVPAHTALSSLVQRPCITDAFSKLDDYQPPDNGGPGRTGGSGTRWRSSAAH